MSILQEICARKAEHVTVKKSETSLDDLKSQINDVEAPRGFLNALRSTPNAAIIAEVKKASPSKGVIRSDFNPEKIAKAYERAGATCISCLTDEPYFQGHDTYLKRLKSCVDIPILRKDFMIDPYQIYESRALGADAILLIMAALDDAQAQALHDLSTNLGMDVLVEIHDAQELERAIALSPSMIGVNNRNLKTMHVDVQTSHDFAAGIPDHIFKVAESGIDSSATLSALEKSGYRAFLIGESLMREPCVETALTNLRQNT